MKDLSIIICTYNPDLTILTRCLHAVANLKKDNINIECFLVDNNSPVAVSTYDIVDSFLNQCPWAQLVVEKEQGLTYARMAGFKKTTAPYIVFFDDDNEPEENYLIETLSFIKRNPKVGAFGPGVIKVDFIDGAEDWLYKEKGYFQESSIDKEQQALDTNSYHESYPFGTGMVLKREILESYHELFLNNKIATTGRKGNNLSSSEDLQLVWLGLRMGYAAGKTPLLKMNHLIQKKKANRNYVKRFLYGGAVSYLPARLEIFPEEKPIAAKQMMSPVKATLLCIKLYLFNFYKKDVDFLLAGQLGSIHGYCQVFEKKPPSFTVRLTKWLKLI